MIPLEVLTHDSLDAFVEHYPLDGIEPFSIVVYRPSVLQELKWDGSKTHVMKHAVDEPHIWASATLYNAEVRVQRRKDFEQWLNTNPAFTQEAIVGFHTQASNDRENGLLIARDSGLHTVSVTSMKHTHGAPAEMRYRDLLTKEESVERLTS